MKLDIRELFVEGEACVWLKWLSLRIVAKTVTDHCDEKLYY